MLSWIKDIIKGVQNQQDCVFCKVRDDPTNQQFNKSRKFLYQDQNYYVIHDIRKASAQQHILIITKKHIRSALNIKDKNQILKMKQIGIKVLKQLELQSEERILKEKLQNEPQKHKILKEQQKYRFGFHVPPYNSIDHIHLHGFLLPFEDWKYDKFFYGWMLSKIEDLIN